jgi:hypothetical protein
LVEPASMLASQAALCLFTGSLEMLVFQMLSAGNMGQWGAPGTGVVSAGTGPELVLTDRASCRPAAGAAAHPATAAVATRVSAMGRIRPLLSHPLGEVTVASSHGWRPLAVVIAGLVWALWEFRRRILGGGSKPERG